MIEVINPARVENVQSEQGKSWGTPTGSDLEEVEIAANPLDSEDMRQVLLRVKGYWEEAKYLHAPNRTAMLKDVRFYDSEQWELDDAKFVEERGQKAIVFNRIAPACDWITGSHKRARFNYKVFPTQNGDTDAADIKTKVIQYLDDVNKIAYEREIAFEDEVQVGLGWTEVGIKGDQGDERISFSQVPWKHMWWDAYAQKRDLSDARYIIRAKYLDLDVAIAMFPDREEQLKQAARRDSGLITEDFFDCIDPWVPTRDGTYTNPSKQSDPFSVAGFKDRERVLLVECWHVLPEKVQRLRTKDADLLALNGLRVDEGHDALTELSQAGIVSLYDATQMTMYCTIWAGDNLLEHRKTPYHHNRFPFVPRWGKRRGETGMPYGMIRSLIGPQEDLNKRYSKALHILCSNRIIADEDAVQDWDNLREQAARPDGIIKKKKGAEIDLQSDHGLDSAHIQLMQMSAQYIDEQSGNRIDQMGQQVNQQQGNTHQNRQDVGVVTTTHFFESDHLAIQLEGELLLSLVEQYMTDEKELYIGGASDPKLVQINKQMPDGSLLNDIAASQCMFKCDRTDYRETVQQALFEHLLKMMGQLNPEISIQLLDVVVEYADVPNKDKLIQRIQEVTGRSPDGSKPEQQPDPLHEAEVAVKQAQAQKFTAEAQSLEVGAQVNQTLAQVKTAKVQHDAENRDIKRAVTVARIQNDAKQLELNQEEIMSRLEDRILRRIQEQLKLQNSGDQFNDKG
jgi:hypothetical protein